MREPYFYYESSVHLVPFESCDARAPTEKEAEILHGKGNNCETVGLHIFDNGSSGDGLTLEVKTDEIPPDGLAIFWARLSMQGARALHETLGNILRMREIEGKP